MSDRWDGADGVNDEVRLGISALPFVERSPETSPYQSSIRHKLFYPGSLDIAEIQEIGTTRTICTGRSPRMYLWSDLRLFPYPARVFCLWCDAPFCSLPRPLVAYSLVIHGCHTQMRHGISQYISGIARLKDNA